MKFIIKISLFCLLFIAVYLFYVNKLSKGYVDQYYNKLTQESGSLVIGLSRADQDIVPQVLEKQLNDLEFDMPITNFAMNLNHSAYGELYLKGIKEKLKPNLKQSLFILSVSPGAFTAPLKMKDEDIFEMDKKGIIGKTKDLKHKPNYDYIINNFEHPLYYSIISLNSWSHHYAHDNGWNEVKLINNSDKLKKEDMLLWKTQTIDYYNKKKELQEVSKYRINGFIETVKYLKTKGEVFLVRLPADADIIDFENSHWQSFNKEMDSISQNQNVAFFNYTMQNTNYQTYDGSHMVSESAKAFTKQLSSDIKEYLKEKNP
ncbi:hypothetical protein L3X37_09705 [Sabulilitoribacter arenilitoris]|uniref:Uncharacterized protein n=1 Tax=Wocania arenilitoris TaxID=2044858 RepID=A0AAE3EQT7_9FLAO|nr:hypothetical protein [Wocania arenilitoris]MCF7568639.1 hypothetical protein [Wocania arenilitoris]